MLHTSMTRRRESKISCVLWVRVMACFLHVNYSNTSQSWVSVISCMQKRIESTLVGYTALYEQLFKKKKK